MHRVGEHLVEYRADSALHAQIDSACAAAGLARRVACEANTMQYLVELVAHGAGVAVLPPMAIGAVPDVLAVPIRPPLRRDIYAVVAAGQPPTGAATALLGLLDAHAARGGAGRVR